MDITEFIIEYVLDNWLELLSSISFIAAAIAALFICRNMEKIDKENKELQEIQDEVIGTYKVHNELLKQKLQCKDAYIAYQDKLIAGMRTRDQENFWKAMNAVSVINAASTAKKKGN